jgi:hypothetical protein
MKEKEQDPLQGKKLRKRKNVRERLEGQKIYKFSNRKNQDKPNSFER